MKNACFAFLLLSCTSAIHAADSAYSALRVVGKAAGGDALKRVVELSGRSGKPEPQVWKVVLKEPQARGGFREIDVQDGQVIAERAPASRPLGSVMNFGQLNLDSAGTAELITREAKKQRVSFAYMDYLLKSATDSGAPLWEVHLFQADGSESAVFRVSADNGVIAEQNILPAGRMRVGNGAPRGNGEAQGESAEDEAVNDLGTFFRRTGQSIGRWGRNVGDFFRGK